MRNAYVKGIIQELADSDALGNRPTLQLSRANDRMNKNAVYLSICSSERFAQTAGYAARPSDCIDAVLVSQNIKCKFAAGIPLLELYSHQGVHLHFAMFVPEGNICFRNLAFVQDR